MNKSVIIALIVGLAVGFGVGFWSGKLGSVNVKEGGTNEAPSGVASTLPTESLSGTIKKKTAGSIIVEVDGSYLPKEREVSVGRDTEITRDGKSASLADLQAGDYIFFTSDENIAEKQKFEVSSIFVKVPAQ